MDFPVFDVDGYNQKIDDLQTMINMYVDRVRAYKAEMRTVDDMNDVLKSTEKTVFLMRSLTILPLVKLRTEMREHVRSMYDTREEKETERLLKTKERSEEFMVEVNKTSIRFGYIAAYCYARTNTVEEFIAEFDKKFEEYVNENGGGGDWVAVGKRIMDWKDHIDKIKSIRIELNDHNV